MRKKIRIPFILFSLLIIAVFYTSCNTAQTPSSSNSSNSEVVYPTWIGIYNGYHNQVVKILATRLDNGKSYQATFAVAANSGSTASDVALPIPENTSYEVTVYTGDSHSIYWNSIYLSILSENAKAKLFISESPTSYTQNLPLSDSYFAGIQASGNN